MPQTNQNQESIINTPTKPANFYELFEKGTLVNTADLLKQTWRIFKNNWKKYIFLILWLYAPLIAFGLLILTAVIMLVIGFPNILSLFREQSTFNILSLGVGLYSAIAVLILVSLLFFLAYLIFSFVVNFALILHTHQIDQNLSIKELLKTAYKKVWGGIWVNTLIGFIILAGYFLFIVPGIIWSIKYSLALYVYLIENKKGMAALKRSAELVKGYWWAILKRYLIWFYAVMGGMLAMMFIPGLNFLANFLTIILTPLGVIYSYNIYRNLKKLKEQGQNLDNYKFKDKFLTFLLISGILIFMTICGGFIALGIYLDKTEKNYKNNPKTNYYEDNWNYGNQYQDQDENNLDYDGEDRSADELLQDDVY